MIDRGIYKSYYYLKTGSRAMILCDNLKTQDILSVIEGGEQIVIGEETRNRIIACFDFLNAFAKDKVIYGINTGFGPMAQWRIDDNHLNELQYNI